MCAHALVHVHHALRDSWILLANLKFSDTLFNRQIAKLKPLLKFPVIPYVNVFKEFYTASNICGYTYMGNDQ